MDLKKRLAYARRSSHQVPITPERAREIDRMVRDNVSKDFICKLYGIDYEDIKNIRKNLTNAQS